MIQERSLLSTKPPPPRDRMQNHPTLLFSWWCTSFSATIILIRICGRKVRSNVLFREDWLMLMALIPLFVRMVFIHFVLIYRTNNVETTGYTFSAEDLYHRSLGAKLVLPGRIFYAAFIWCCKLTVSEFLKRITIRIWRPAYEMTLRGIRIFLLLTFVAVVIATLAECQPFHHYWQVIPDPGPSCRLGYGHLFTMGICDVITDFLLIIFPIPIVLMSGQSWQRKLQLLSLFGLSVVMIGITVTRMTMVVRHQGLQQYRTVWASCEILASAATSNAVVLGSFVRGKGTKRNRYVSYSGSDSIDRVSTRRPTLRSYGSDEDLFRSVGCRLPEDLESKDECRPRPAPPASPAPPGSPLSPVTTFSSTNRAPTHDAAFRGFGDDLARDFSMGRVLPSPSASTDRSGSLTDASPLSDEGTSAKGYVDAGHIIWPPKARSSDASVVAHDFAPLVPSRTRGRPHSGMPEPAAPASPRGRASPSPSLYPFRFFQRHLSGGNRYGSPSTGVRGSILERHETEQSLQDAGGLLRCVSNPSGVRDYFPTWPEPALTRSATQPALIATTCEQSPTLEDVGGLLSDSSPPDVTTTARK